MENMRILVLWCLPSHYRYHRQPLYWYNTLITLLSWNNLSAYLYRIPCICEYGVCCRNSLTAYSMNYALQSLVGKQSFPSSNPFHKAWLFGQNIFCLDIFCPDIICLYIFCPIYFVWVYFVLPLFIHSLNFICITDKVIGRRTIHRFLHFIFSHVHELHNEISLVQKEIVFYGSKTTKASNTHITTGVSDPQVLLCWQIKPVNQRPTDIIRYRWMACSYKPTTIFNEGSWWNTTIHTFRGVNYDAQKGFCHLSIIRYALHCSELCQSSHVIIVNQLSTVKGQSTFESNLSESLLNTRCWP